MLRRVGIAQAIVKASKNNLKSGYLLPPPRFIGQSASTGETYTASLAGKGDAIGDMMNLTSSWV